MTPHLRMTSGDIVMHDLRAVDHNREPIDLSAYTDIIVAAFATENNAPTGAALITDDLDGDVALVGGGTGGRFQVPWAAADTATLAGLYWVEVQLVNAAGAVRTTHFTVQIGADLITA